MPGLRQIVFCRVPGFALYRSTGARLDRDGDPGPAAIRPVAGDFTSARGTLKAILMQSGIDVKVLPEVMVPVHPSMLVLMYSFTEFCIVL
jgi:hypothetical protein